MLHATHEQLALIRRLVKEYQVLRIALVSSSLMLDEGFSKIDILGMATRPPNFCG